eukprot:CAMPEP_0198138484 /NCGR_PEP_ID=MMETSP1443-20131203/1882_1 /TAXON_ID=186043 /ORGANISM="Entomoneis sp., Strain CCMP2396" /LENGTH=850 /DNA_ID=CAMNT_0043800275 /DNA_START=34 /DNA_END=2586 /DNA_ORIENTATION=+
MIARTRAEALLWLFFSLIVGKCHAMPVIRGAAAAAAAAANSVSNDVRNDQHERRVSSPRIGTNFNALVVLMRFSNHEGRTLPDRSYFQNMCDGPVSQDINPVGSAADYFKLQSGDKYQVTCEVTDWITTDGTEAQYAYGNSGLKGAIQSQQMFHSVMNTVQDQEISEFGLNWFTRFNRQSLPETTFDAIIFIHSGHSAVSLCTDDGTLPADRHASKAFANSPLAGTWKSSTNEFAQFISVGGFGIVSAFSDANCEDPTPMGIFAHEWAHTFGNIPDLYDFSKIIDTSNPGGIGFYGLMSVVTGGVVNNAPGSISPYIRQELGWADITDITEDKEYSISDSSSGTQIYRIKHNYVDNEYLLIENRQKNKFDVNAVGDGILIWHVDENVDIDTSNQETSYPEADDGLWPSVHYRVALVQRDGNFDLEQGINARDANDYWNQPLQTLTPGSGGVQPNTDSYANGETGFSIRILTSSQTVMKFFVSGISSPAVPFPVDGDDVTTTTAATTTTTTTAPGVTTPTTTAPGVTTTNTADPGVTTPTSADPGVPTKPVIAVGDDDDDDSATSSTGIDVQLLSGRFTVYDETDGSGQDQNSIAVQVDSVREIAADGETVVGNTGDVKHSFETLADQVFNITFQGPADTSVDGRFGGIQSERTSFSTVLMSGVGNTVEIGTLEIDTYIFAEAGTIIVGEGNSTEEYDVDKQDVKFNLKLSDWNFCGGTCGAQGDEAAEFVDVSIEIKGKDGAPVQDAEEETLFDLGANIDLVLSTKVYLSDTEAWVEMPAGYPKMETMGDKTVFTFRFSKFTGVATYDPVMKYSKSFDFVGVTSGAMAGLGSDLFLSISIFGICLLALFL